VKLPNGPVIREVKSQLTRSGTSIGANYFEARGASSKKDFQNFFAIALKSANESIFWLNVLKDVGFISKEIEKEHQDLVSETKEIAKILASSILTMKGKRK
jgi:four helix bundle protein